MDHTFLSALVLLLLVLDPFGSLPIFISVMRNVAPERRTRVAVRLPLSPPARATGGELEERLASRGSPHLLGNHILPIRCAYWR